MLTQLLDVFGFLSVLLRGAALALNSLIAGGAIFLAWVLRSDYPELSEPARRVIVWAAAALAAVQACNLAADSAVLSATTGSGLWDVAGANFFLAGLAGIGGALTIVRIAGHRQWVWAPAAVTLASLVATSHAMGRLEHRAILMALTATHQAAAAIWIGGLPYLVLALVRCRDLQATEVICRRFSGVALGGVAALAGSGAALSTVYVGSPAAAYGTSYGAMLSCKGLLLVLLLVLGCLNRRMVSKVNFKLMRCFCEAEIGIGITALLAAASLTSQPPSVDLQEGRVTAAEVAARMRPQWPRLSTPPLSDLTPPTLLNAGSGGTAFVPGDSYSPNAPGDIAWSEYNHHWAGLIVLGAGLLALLARSGVAPWARNWPLAFLGLAVFLFLRADPENWPLGPKSFWQSFAVAEVLQHRIFVVLIVAFAGFEWGVRTGRIQNGRASLVFPAVCAAGGALLLTHAHPIGNIKESLLAELSHIPLAIFAVAAGWARWIELRGSKTVQRIPSWIWPACLLLIGAVLLNYRES